MRTAAVILAADASTRFGSWKQEARIEGRTMLATVAGIAARAGLHPIVAVVPPGLPVPASVVPELNADPAAGLSRSLRLGLDAVPPEEADGAVILLGDQPTLDPTVIELLLVEGGERPVVAARAGGRIGPPVLIRRDAFGLAAEASGDEGLRDVLRAHRHLVSEVEVGEHAPDVDRPEDLERLAPACPGCGMHYLPVDAPTTHPYIGASAACWARFSELLAREYSDVAYGRLHRHSVDVYSVQHPGRDERRERQSVAVHLIGLCHWLEHGLEAAQLTPITQRLASEDRAWPWLEPPTTFPVTVPDVLRARDGLEHGRLVRRWAETTWDAWGAHRDLVRGWASEALAVDRRGR
jgi:CTP:molybdopterin cytidylyltransferase MocA